MATFQQLAQEAHDELDVALDIAESIGRGGVVQASSDMETQRTLALSRQQRLRATHEYFQRIKAIVEQLDQMSRHDDDISDSPVGSWTESRMAAYTDQQRFTDAAQGEGFMGDTRVAIHGTLAGLILIALAYPEHKPNFLRLAERIVNFTGEKNKGSEMTFKERTDRLPGGKADRRSPSEFDRHELKIGMRHEMEHVDDRALAQEIAMDHLAEDPRYYSKLAACGKLVGLDEDRSLLDVYRNAGARTDEQVLAMAASMGEQALLEARSALLIEGPAAKSLHDELDIILDQVEEGSLNWRPMLTDLLDRAIELYSSGRADGESADWRSMMPFQFSWGDFDDQRMIKPSVPEEKKVPALKTAAHITLQMILDPTSQKGIVNPYTPLMRQGGPSFRVMNTEWGPETMARFRGTIMNYAEQIFDLVEGSRKTFESHLHENVSTTVAVTIVKGLPPGKNICAWLRQLAQQYGKLIVLVQPGRVEYSTIVKMIRVSLPDAAAKMETYRLPDAEPSFGAMQQIFSRSPSMRDGGTADVIVDQRTASALAPEAQADGGLIRILAKPVPHDSDERIMRAIQMDDVRSLQQLLDPMVFSSPDRIQAFKSGIIEGREPDLSVDQTHVMELAVAIRDEAESGRVNFETFNDLISEIIALPITKGPVTQQYPRDSRLVDISSKGLGQQPPREAFLWWIQILIWAHCFPLNWVDGAFDKFIENAEESLRAIKPHLNIWNKEESFSTSNNEAISEAGFNVLPSPGASMRGNNSSAWSSGRAVLAKPSDNVPEDEEDDRAFDQGAYFGYGLAGGARGGSV